MKLLTQISSSYRRPVIEAAGLSAVLLILSFMILDLGQVALASMCAMVGFWIGVLLIVLRRPRSPTKADLLIIRLGPLFFVVAAQFFVQWMCI
jgi:hypothetical protein